MIFKTIQSDLQKYDGQKILKKEPLDESKYDKEEVGFMFEITLQDGILLHAFEDEIIE